MKPVPLYSGHTPIQHQPLGSCTLLECGVCNKQGALYWTTLMPHASIPWNRKLWDLFSDMCRPIVPPMQRAIAPHVYWLAPTIHASS